MYIRFNDPSLNRNIVKFQLPYTYGMWCCSTPLLSISSSILLSAGPLQWAHISLCHTSCVTPTALVNMVLPQRMPNPFWLHVSPFTHPLVPYVVSLILVSITLFSDLTKPCCLSWQKFVIIKNTFFFCNFTRSFLNNTTKY